MHIKSVYHSLNNIKINTTTNKKTAIILQDNNTTASSLDALAALGQTQVNFRGKDVQRTFSSGLEFIEKKAELPNGENFSGIVVLYSDYYPNNEPAIIKYKEGCAIESSYKWNKNGDISTLVKSGFIFPEEFWTESEKPQKILFNDSDPDKSSFSIEYNPKDGRITRVEEKNDLFGVIGIHSFREDGSFIKRIYTPDGICYVTTRDKIGYTDQYVKSSLLQGRYPN